jgi:glycosyltransferase involved in cell wall biosynthesis
MLSLVMPCFNEADIIEASVREWYGEVISKLPESELCVVDDCSTDGTYAILQRLEKELPALRVLRPARNGGHGRAVRFSLDRATKEFVFQTDSDRQHQPSDFWKLWDIRADYDFVFGVRTHRADGALRVAITSAMKLLNFLFWGIWISDANCPFKLMRRDALNAVLARIPESFIPMVQVSLLARRMRFRIAELPVAHFPRTGGTQSLRGIVRWARVSVTCARELAALRLRT